MIVAETYEGAANLSELTRDTLVDYATVVDGTQVYWTKLVDETDIEQSVENGRPKPTYLRVQTYQSLYQ